MKKLEEQDLNRLVELNRRYRDLKFEVADIELTFERLKSQKLTVMTDLEIAVQEFSSFQKDVQERYGASNINLLTGEYN